MCNFIILYLIFTIHVSNKCYVHFFWVKNFKFFLGEKEGVRMLQIKIRGHYVTMLKVRESVISPFPNKCVVLSFSRDQKTRGLPRHTSPAPDARGLKVL